MRGAQTGKYTSHTASTTSGGAQAGFTERSIGRSRRKVWICHYMAGAERLNAHNPNPNRRTPWALKPFPRHQHAVTVFDNPDVVLVDLSAELPSYCARPHVQQAAFIARRGAAYNDIEADDPVHEEDADIDALCLAHIGLQFDGAARFYEPRKAAATLYPKSGTACSQCGTKQPDMNSDYLLHILECFKSPNNLPKPPGFPEARS